MREYITFLDDSLGPECSAVLLFIQLGAWGPRKDLAAARSPAAVLQATLHRSQAQLAAQPRLASALADLVGPRFLNERRYTLNKNVL
jgi:hypothetical protein